MWSWSALRYFPTVASFPAPSPPANLVFNLLDLSRLAELLVEFVFFCRERKAMHAIFKRQYNSTESPGGCSPRHHSNFQMTVVPHTTPSRFPSTRQIVSTNPLLVETAPPPPTNHSASLASCANQKRKKKSVLNPHPTFKTK